MTGPRRDPDRIRTDPAPYPPRRPEPYEDPMNVFYGPIDHERIDRIVRDMYR